MDDKIDDEKKKKNVEWGTGDINATGEEENYYEEDVDIQ